MPMSRTWAVTVVVISSVGTLGVASLDNLRHDVLVGVVVVIVVGTRNAVAQLRITLMNTHGTSVNPAASDGDCHHDTKASPEETVLVWGGQAATSTARKANSDVTSWTLVQTFHHNGRHRQQVAVVVLLLLMATGKTRVGAVTT